MPLEIDILSTGDTTRDRFFDLLNRPTKKAGDCFEMGADEYDEMLNVLPPLGWIGSAFAMSEFWSFDLTNSFHRVGGRYFCLMIVCSPIERIAAEQVEQAHAELKVALRPILKGHAA